MVTFLSLDRLCLSSSRAPGSACSARSSSRFAIYSSSGILAVTSHNIHHISELPHTAERHVPEITVSEMLKASSNDLRFLPAQYPFRHGYVTMCARTLRKPQMHRSSRRRDSRRFYPGHIVPWKASPATAAPWSRQKRWGATAPPMEMGQTAAAARTSPARAAAAVPDGERG